MSAGTVLSWASHVKSLSKWVWLLQLSKPSMDRNFGWGPWMIFIETHNSGSYAKVEPNVDIALDLAHLTCVDCAPVLFGMAKDLLIYCWGPLKASSLLSETQRHVIAWRYGNALCELVSEAHVYIRQSPFGWVWWRSVVHHQKHK